MRTRRLLDVVPFEISQCHCPAVAQCAQKLSGFALLARWSPSRQCCLRACSTCHASCCTAWRRAPRGASPRCILRCSYLESDILSIMLVAVPIYLSINPCRHIILMLVAVPIFLSINPSRHIICILVAVPIYLSVNPSRHIIHNYASCCSHLPVCQSVQTHYPYVICFPIYLSVNPSRHIIHNYVSCCPHLPVNPSRHIIRMLVAVPIYLSINPFISVLVGLFQPLRSVGKGCPHCCCACFQ